MQFLRKWTSGPKKGRTIGDKTCNGYMGDIAQMFTAGAMSKCAKMSGDMMRTALLAKYPRSYDIPLEHHLNSAIQNLVGKQPNVTRDVSHGEGNSSGARAEGAVDMPVHHVTGNGRGRNSTFRHALLTVLRDAVEADPNFMSRHGMYLVLRSGLGSASDAAVRRIVTLLRKGND